MKNEEIKKYIAHLIASKEGEKIKILERLLKLFKDDTAKLEGKDKKKL